MSPGECIITSSECATLKGVLIKPGTGNEETGNEETRKWRNEEMKKRENMHQIFHSISDKLEISGESQMSITRV